MGYGLQTVVVIITTKIGKNRTTQVYFDGYLSVQGQAQTTQSVKCTAVCDHVPPGGSKVSIKKVYFFCALAQSGFPDKCGLGQQMPFNRTGLTQNHHLAIRGGNHKIQLPFALAITITSESQQGFTSKQLNV